MDDKNPKGLKNLLTSSEDRGARNKASFSDAASKKPEDLVEEEIDSQVLSILGLEDVFDLTYEEYATLLKEAAVRGRMANSQMTTESVELVTNELKRVKGKTGRFKVKQKKINIDKVLDRKTPSDSSAMVNYQKLLPPTLEKEETDIVKTKTSQDEIQIGIQNILTSLITVRGLLEGQSKSDQETAKVERKKSERTKKRDREDSLEKKKEDEFKLPKVISTPIDNFFESIKRYFKNILLGSVVLGLYKWLKNPANEKTINDFGNFLTNNAPLILGGLLAIAALPIASALLGVTSAVLGGIPTLIGALGFLATPAGLFALTTYLARKGLYKLALPPLAKGMNKAIEFGYKKDYGAAGAAKGKFITKLRDQYGRVAPKAEFEKMTGDEKTTASFLQMYDDELKNRQKINNELYELKRDMKAMPQQEWRYKPQIKQKEDELKESDKKIKQIESQISIGGKSFSQLQKQFEEKGESALPQTSLSKRLYPSQIVKPQTPKATDYKSPFAGEREREALKASKITGNAPITVGEKASAYSASRGRAHRGRDIAAPSGTGLQVSSDSVITDKGIDNGGYGNYVTFKDSNGIEHLYGHMLEASPYNKGDQVPAGTVIGRVGSTGSSTGPHLHWEVSRVMGEVGRPRANIIDPIEIGFPAEAPFTGKVEAAQLAQTKPPTPSIPSPTGRSNIVPLPIPTQTQQASQSNSAPLQTPVPFFSSEDPNNMTTLVVKAIYNVVG